MTSSTVSTGADWRQFDPQDAREGLVHDVWHAAEDWFGERGMRGPRAHEHSLRCRYVAGHQVVEFDLATGDLLRVCYVLDLGALSIQWVAIVGGAL